EDIALAPTQILSPEKMLAYQTNRWQHEVERDRPLAGQDVAEMPTMMISPVGLSPFKEAVPVTPVARTSSGPAQPDIAEMPTVLITPGEIAPPPPEPQDVASGPSNDEYATTLAEQAPSSGETGATAETLAETQRPGTASSSLEAAPSPTSEEDVMEHVPPSTDNQFP